MAREEGVAKAERDVATIFQLVSRPEAELSAQRIVKNDEENYRVAYPHNQVIDLARDYLMVIAELHKLYKRS